MVEIDHLVFAGGGCRCLWQLGFWEAIRGPMDLSPKSIAATSAGSLMACVAVTDKIQESLEVFKELTAANEKNMYLKNIRSNKPVFPQYEIYKRGLEALFTQTDLGNIKTNTDIRILISRPPKYLGPVSGTITGLLTYSLEKKIKHPVHPTWPVRMGFFPEVVSVSSCQTIDELFDLILQSSCTPPMVPILKRNAYPVLDGGIIDNVPVMALEDTGENQLVFLTRQYPADRIPKNPGKIYIQPSTPIRISKWDYTDPEGLQEAFDLGRKDGDAFIKRFG